MDWFVEPLGYGFIRIGLLAGLLTVVMTSVVGTWVVLRGMSFMGDALAHGVLPGIAVAHLAAFDLTIGAALGAGVMVAGVNVVHRRARLAEDVGIALLFVGMLALGVAIVSTSSSFAGALTSFLFGDPLGVTTQDVVVTAVAVVVTLVVSVALYRPFLVLTFSEVKAEALGLRPKATHAALLALVALAIVTSFRTVGTLLVFAFIVAPPATAALFARRVPVMTLAAIGFGAVGVVVGMLVSYHMGTAAAPTIALVTVLEFFLVLTVRDSITAARRRSAAPAP
ncbi:MAG: metal ABC transporter permease [Actinobacteria bacterium]|nr:metal ABC transporter permease [Actinomycetota bacterium]